MKLMEQRILDQAGLVSVLEQEISDNEREAFEDMLFQVEKRPLSPKQRYWVNSVLERFDGTEPIGGLEDDGTPPEQRFTDGDIPRGKDVEPMWKDKPLKPPMKKTS